LKFDNFAYKLSETIIEDDYRGHSVPKIYAKFLYVYFIDPSSGFDSIKKQELFDIRFREYLTINESDAWILDKLKEIYDNHMYEEDKLKAYKHIIYQFNNGFSLDIYGRGKFEIISDQELIHHIDKSSLNEEIKKISNNAYFFDTDKFNFQNIDQLIYFINNKIKCSNCKNWIEHDSLLCNYCGIKIKM